MIIKSVVRGDYYTLTVRSGRSGMEVREITPRWRSALSPRVILVPGLWHTANHWQEVQEHLAFYFRFPFYLGNIASSAITMRPPERNVTPADFVEDLLTAVSLYPKERKVLVGHSNGGAVILASSEKLFSSDFAAEICGLVFINTVVPLQFRQGVTWAMLKTTLKYFPDLVRGNPVKLSAADERFLLFSGQEHQHPTFEPTPSKVALSIIRSTAFFSLLPWLGYRPKIVLPAGLKVLVISSKQDRAVGYNNSERFHRKLKKLGLNSTLIATNGSHEIILTNPEEIALMIARFANP